MKQWYRMNDAEPAGMLPIEQADAETWNASGFGIFWAVQEFKDATRRIDNLERIVAWAVDLDEGTKKEQQRRLEKAPLMPSMVVETKNGYHAYWFAKDGATAEMYRPLVTRMVENLGGDRNARDVARVLRVPGFLHLKDPSAPFRVATVYGPYSERKYSEQTMLESFPRIAEEPPKEYRAQRPIGTGVGLWERVYNLDCMDALTRLSGTGYVSGEQFTFQPVRKTGKHNILVNGKGTSCWVDRDGRIGSSDRGGPTIYNWLHWYGHSPRECVRIIKETYPQIEEE